MFKKTQPIHQISMCMVTMVLTVALAAPAVARPNKGKSAEAEVSIGFRGSDRDVVRGYFDPEIRGGNCPPGLAKKRNGCQPPGQAKKQWTKRRPLPPAVIYEPLPAELVVRLGPPPPNHEYVRVAGDILMLAVGTHMVVDAITDLGGALR